MGLDVSAYSYLEFVRPLGGGDDEDEDLVRIYGVRGLPDRLDGQPQGYYRRLPESDDFYFSAGSYSGYNWWRAELSRFALKVEPGSVWGTGEQRFRGEPFVELINFSDCEGAIGPETSRKLAADFEAWHERAVAHSEKLGGQFWLPYFENWRKAFALAAGSGFVVLH